MKTHLQTPESHAVKGRTGRFSETPPSQGFRLPAETAETVWQEMPGYGPQIQRSPDETGPEPPQIGHGFITGPVDATPLKGKKSVPLATGMEVKILETTGTDHLVKVIVEGVEKTVRVPLGSVLVSPNKLSEAPAGMRTNAQFANINPDTPRLMTSFYAGLGGAAQDFASKNLFVNYSNLDASLWGGFSSIISTLFSYGVSFDTGRDFKGAAVTQMFALDFTDLRTNAPTLPPAVLDRYAGKQFVFRFSRLATVDPVGAGNPNMMLIEEVGEEKADPRTDDELKVKFDAHGFKLQPGGTVDREIDGVKPQVYLNWEPDTLRQLYLAINRIPDTILEQVKGYTFGRQAANPKPGVRAEHQSSWNGIVVYDDAIAADASRYGSEGSQQFATRLQYTITHELGHAVDYSQLRWADEKRDEVNSRLTPARDALNLSVDAYNAALKAFAEKYKAYLKEGTNSYSLPPNVSKNFEADKKAYKPLKDKSETDRATYDRINTEYDAADTDYKSKSWYSGSKWDYTTKQWTETATDFDTALKDPSEGIRVTAYSNENDKEAFAEAFALYITTPETLNLLSPVLYNYFLVKFPK